MAPDLLDPSALVASLPTLLPGETKTLDSPQDAIVALLHTALIALSFRLIGVDELTPSSVSVSDNVLPSVWNNHGPGYYTLVYKHDQSSLNFLIKLIKLGKRTVINAIPLQSDKLSSLEFSTDDFTSPSFFPKVVNGSQPLVHGFISSNRISDLISQFKLKIISNLMPGLQKDGYTEAVEQASSSSSRPLDRGPISAPRPERPPDAPEGYPYPFNHPVTPRNPLEIGRSDRTPFSANPFTPPPLFSDDSNGMFVGPDHPIFNRRLVQTSGPWGGDGYLPPLGAPPGARFDPVGPRTGLGRGGHTPRRFSNEPDNDEFMPPGMGDSFM